MATGTIYAEFPAIGGTQKLYHGGIALDSSYVGAGGEAIDFTNNARMESLVISPIGGRSFEWDDENQKLLVYEVGMSGTVVIDPASLNTDVTANETVTVTGLATTDLVRVIPPITLESGLVVQSADVSATNTLRVRLSNVSAGTVNAASATWTWQVLSRKEVIAGTDLSALGELLFIGIGS